MPQTIQIRDINGAPAISPMGGEPHEGEAWLLEAYDKLAAAEAEIREGKTADARAALKGLRAKYGL